MKRLSASTMCVFVILAFVILALISHIHQLPVTGFFGACAGIFFVILPACSPRN